MLRRLYDWVLALAARKDAPLVLGAVSFAESSVFPIPPDVVLMPMALAKRRHAFRFALICTITSVLGGVAGYAIGYFLYESVGRPLLELYRYADEFGEFQGLYNEWGAWIVFIAGVTPFPYKVITIASGVTRLDLVVFMVASVLARGLRFYLVAGLLYLYGPPIKAFIERYLGLLTILFCILLAGGFAALEYLL